MNTHYILLWLFLALFTSCCNNSPHHPTADKIKYDPIPGKDYAPEAGADCYNNKGDHPHSPYYVNPDFYSLTSNDTLTIIPRFRTMQQTTEWSCGDVAALMVLHHFGKKDATEWELAEAMHSMCNRKTPGAEPGSACEYCDYGTSLQALFNYFSNLDGFRIVESSYKTSYSKDDLVKQTDCYPACDRGNLYPTFSDPALFATWLTAHLKANRPVMVEWCDWDGHWVDIIGYDNGGTPDFPGDDVLIFADPYDTSDHWQDGYSIAPLERFFYSWKDRAIAPKPYQLQPFLVVEPI